MSFSSELKSQIIVQPQKNLCCRRALLYGVVFCKGTERDGNISLSLQGTEIIEYVCELVREFFGKEAEVLRDARGGRCRILTFRSPACQKYLASLTAGTENYFQGKCPGCTSAFLRGVFLSSGRVSDPQKQYRIEFAPHARHHELLDFLNSLGLLFSSARRRGESIIYSGNSSVAEDFFAEIGMNSTAFLLMNSKIENEFKNTANRIRNCETNNIMKTVSAAARWIEAIEALEKANLLSSLPEELEKTAKLRLLYRDYSLSRLASEFTPPISKPGLSHRLNKIVELSENLLRKK